MSEPAPEKKEAAPPLAPALGELLELSLMALVNAPGVFRRLSSRPAASPGASLLAALAWGGAFFALNLIYAALSHPVALAAYEPWKIAAVGFFALGLWTGLYLLGSSLVYALGRMLGSGGDFDRALLIASVTLAAAPLQALCSWFPMAEVVPTIVAAWILACGLNALFKMDPWTARGACAALAACVLGLQYGAGLAIERYGVPFQIAAAATQAAPASDQIDLLQQQMQQQLLQARALAAEAQNSAVNAPSGQSSLDLLRGPVAGEAPPPTGPSQIQQLAAMSSQADAMNKSVIGMLDSMAPMLNNPAITQNMTPQQKADYDELKTLILELRNGMAANKVISPQEQQAKMIKVQQLVMRMMSAGVSGPKRPATSAPGAKK